MISPKSSCERHLLYREAHEGGQAPEELVHGGGDFDVRFAHRSRYPACRPADIGAL